MRLDFMRIGLVGGLAIACGAPLLAAVGGGPTPEETRFFETSVRPVLVEQCGSCHGANKPAAGLRLDSRAALLKGGARGPALVPGAPDGSLLLTAISYQHGTLKMPPAGKLSDRQIGDLTRWVKMGAPWPVEWRKDEGGRMKGPGAASAVNPSQSGAQHWSFRPLREPKVPPMKNGAWVRTPVDAFVLARLEASGLKPALPADRRTLIRRATFNLIGLPPTPAEVDAFLADTAPNAFARVVDRLLQSPHYGERWGRHWLDVARYADSNGLDENVAYANAWRYRDYVVSSFNRDKPYDQFLLEQLAGDLLPPVEDVPTRHERLIATGFLVLGPKVLAEVDSKKMEMDIVDEQVDTVGRSIMGLTLGCARCHDHKFDPISTEDYYALAGVFKSTRSMENFTKPARWHENSLATEGDLARQAAHAKQVTDAKAAIAGVVARAKAQLPAPAPGAAPPKDEESLFPEETRAELKRLRADLARLESSPPEMPSAMGVTEGTVADVPVHLRGSHLSLGKPVVRRFPVILAGEQQAPLEAKQSGRLQLARWLVGREHPLTSRVMANRIWRWHFGQGLSRSTDNFGRLGEPPTDPALLDWLAVRFMKDGWSLKKMHRLLMLSSAYAMSAAHDPRAAKLDPENRLHWRAEVRRLEAEAVRDALLAVSGTLDPTMGGTLLPLKNREYVFDHTSRDATRYDSRRRSIYLPVIRNNVYDVFQLFDFADPAVLDGNRATTTVAPQALFMMNSDLVHAAATAMADRLLERRELDDAGRIRLLYLQAYARPVKASEAARARLFLSRLEGAQAGADADPAKRRRNAWTWLCHSLMAANEFLYVR